MSVFAIGVLLLTVAAQDTSKIVVEHFAERGGLNRTLFVSKGEGVLRVVTGGALASASDKGEAFLAELLASSGLDAIAVGYEDLAAGGPDRRALLSSAKIPFLCANVKGAGKPWVLKAIGGAKVALVGVTQVPASRKDFALAPGWTIESPAETLKALLPTLTREADLIVLLAVMDRVEAARLLKEVPGIHAALVPAAADSDPDPLQAGATWIVQSSAHPSVFSQTTLSVDARKLTSVSNRLETGALSEADRARLRALFTKHKEGVEVDRLVSGIVIAGAAAPPKETGPLRALASGRTEPVVLRRSDGSVEIQIESVRIQDTVGGRAAPAGSAWLLIESAWKNLIPLSSLGGRELPTAYSVGDAGNNLYLIVNGKRLSRLDVELSGGEGGLLTRASIHVDRLGAVRRGRLVFPVPSSGVESLALHFLDFRHPPAVFPLLEPVKKPEEKAVAPAAKNEVMEIALYGFERTAALGTRKAPPGMTYVVVDVRARSTATLDTPDGPVGVVGELGEMTRSLKLVDDGNRSFETCEGTELLETPRFLPNVLTGERVAFLVPEKAAGLLLRCEFGEIGLPDGKVVKPPPMMFALDAGARSCPKCRRAAAAGEKFCADCGTRLDR